MKKLCILTILMTLSLSAIALPKQVRAEYELAKKGKVVGKVKEIFTQDGQDYRIESTAKGIGVYALLGKRVQKSEGKISKEGLKPSRYELAREMSAHKSLVALFDWPNKVLQMQLDDETREAKLEPGAQDTLSLMYQFLAAAPSKNKMQIAVTTGKHLSTHNYQLDSKTVPFATKAGKFNVKKLVLVDDPNGDKKEILFAADKAWVPVKLTLVDDGELFEQTLTKLSITD